MDNPRYPDPRREGPHLAGEFLQRFLDDVLTPEETKRLKAHLKACECLVCAEGLGDVSDEVFDASLVWRLGRARKEGAAAQRGWEAVKRMLLKKGLIKPE